MVNRSVGLWAALACALTAYGCSDDELKPAGTGGAPSGGGGGAGGMMPTGGALALTSSAVMNGMMLPAKYRCTSTPGGPTGPNPPLAWTGAPTGTLSFAIILRDRTFANFQHWTIYDIPASTTMLPEAVAVGATTMPAGAKQADNNAPLTGPGYYGPCGASGMNTYEFKLYALDVATLPNPGTTGTTVEAALEMHDLATSSLMVTSGPP